MKTRYADFSELLQYCEGSANPVGQIILQVGRCGVWSIPDRSVAFVNEESRSVAIWSNRICTGLQLANHWQDIARDFKIGRVYLPQDDMLRYEVTDQHLAAPTAPQNLRRLLKFQCDRAESLLVGGLPLVEHVPRWLPPICECSLRVD